MQCQSPGVLVWPRPPWLSARHSEQPRDAKGSPSGVAQGTRLQSGAAMEWQPAVQQLGFVPQETPASAITGHQQPAPAITAGYQQSVPAIIAGYQRPAPAIAAGWTPVESRQMVSRQSYGGSVSPQGQMAPQSGV